MVEVDLLAHQLVAFKDEDQYRLDFHGLSGCFNARPDAAVSSAKPALDDYCVVGMMEGGSVEVKVRKGGKQAAD